MYQFILLLLHVAPQAHVEPQAWAKHDFDLQLKANISLFFLPFGVFTVITSHFFENLFI